MNESPEPRTRLKTIIVFSMLFAIFGAVVVFGYFTTFSRPITTVILVRHAEKKIEPNNPDPDLTPAGEARAQEIARMFSGAGLNAIYATHLKRTQQTVKPLADRTGLSPTILNANQTDELARQILTDHRGQTIFVAGHNNTVPALVSILSGEIFPVIPESEYDNLFIVTVYRFGKAKVVKLKYGSESTQGVGSGTMVPTKTQ
jgi:phosphohistidine phosphatase SixA